MAPRAGSIPGSASAGTFFATTPALSGGFLYVTDDNGQAYKLDAATGSEKWKVKTEGAIRSAPVVSNDVVYFGTGSSHCYALNADTGQVIWDVPTGGAVTTSPTITGGLVVFASSDNSIYSLTIRNGHKAWSAPFETDPSPVPVVYDGTQLYVTSGDTVYRLDPSSGVKKGRGQAADKYPAATDSQRRHAVCHHAEQRALCDDTEGTGTVADHAGHGGDGSAASDRRPAAGRNPVRCAERL